MISCLALHGKKFNVQYPKIILFLLKKSMNKKEFSFYFIKFSWKHIFMKEFKWKIFTITILLISQWKLIYIYIQHCNLRWIKTNLAGRKLLTAHHYTFEFSPLYFFRLNWVGYLFHCSTGTLRKQSFLHPDAL